MRGWLLPAHDVPGFPETGETMATHTLHYTPASGGAHIQLVADASDIPDDVTGQLWAEAYLGALPGSAARTSVEKALAELMPRFDV